MFLAAIAFVSLQQEPLDLDQRITLSTVAVPASKLLAQLEEKTHIRFAAEPETAGEVLAVHVTDVPLRELIARIATTSSALWKEERRTMILAPDKALRMQQAKAAREKIAADLAKSVKHILKLRKEISDGGVKLLAIETFEDGSSQAPAGGGELIWNMASALDPQVIANLPIYGRVVYSTVPTKMQLRAPSVNRMIVQAAVREHNDALGTGKDQGDKMSELLGGAEREMKLRRIEAEPAKILLAVESFGRSGAFSMKLKCYDGQGRVVLSDEATLGAKPPEEPVPDIPAFIAQDKDRPIEFSPLSVEVCKATKALADGGKPTLSPELLERLRRPDEFDPLAFVPSDALLDIAKTQKLNLVANIPDNMAGFMTDLDKVTQNEYLKRAVMLKRAKVELETGWLTFRPLDGLSARNDRVGRKPLSVLIHSVREKEVPRLDDLGDYARTEEMPDAFPVSYPYVWYFMPLAQRWGQLDWLTVRLYGSLPKAQRNVISGGGKLDFASLSPESFNLVESQVFGAHAQLLTREAGQTLPSLNLFERAQLYRASREGDYRFEPTESMPNGLPRDGFFFSNVRSDYSLSLDPEQARAVGMPPIVGTEEVGAYQALLSMSDAAKKIPPLNEVRLGERKLIDLNVMLLPTLYMYRYLVDDDLARDAKAVSLDGLPSAVRQRIEAQALAIKTSGLLDPSFLRGGQPPP